MSHLIKLSVLAASLALYSTTALAFSGDPEAGAEKAKTCTSCHGKEGVAVSDQYPNLAGQHADYLVQALHEYQTGQRKSAIMKQFASGLSDQDIEDIAAYFASQDRVLDSLKGHRQGD